jgi:hypothetical protein
MGKNIPIIPNIIETVPSVIKSDFFNLFIFIKTHRLI